MKRISKIRGWGLRGMTLAVGGLALSLQVGSAAAGELLSAEQIARALVPQPAASAPAPQGEVTRSWGSKPAATEQGTNGGGLSRSWAPVTRGYTSSTPPENPSPSRTLPLQIEFANGSHELTPAGVSQINELLVALGLVTQQVTRSYGAGAGVQFDVVGHTNRTGDEAFNMELSRRRALAVQAYLQKRGFVGKLRTEGMGWHQPHVMPAEDAANRRVDITAIVVSN